MQFLEQQKAKLLQYKEMASQTEAELVQIQAKFNEYKEAQLQLQKTHAEAQDRFKSYLQSAFVLEGVIKDLDESLKEPVVEPTEVEGPQEDPLKVSWVNPNPVEEAPVPESVPEAEIVSEKKSKG